MKTIKYIAVCLAPLLVLLVVIGCQKDLSVTNLNAPDKDRALASPNDVEKLAGGAFRQWWWSQVYRPWAFSVMADEFTSSWGNFGMRDTGSEPRKAWDNSPSYGYDSVNRYPWRYCYRAISAVNDPLSQVEGGMKIVDEEGNDMTMFVKTWAKFIQGISLGFLGQVFDKAFIIDETTDLAAKQQPFPYTEVHARGMEKLQEAIDLCKSNSFTIPSTYMPILGKEYTNVDLEKLAHSFMARYMAGVARSPEERAAADWASIANHAANGITEDVEFDCDGDIWWSYLAGLMMNKGWLRSDYKLIGPADTSGNYEAWLNTPVDDRNEFFIETNDKRVTGGAHDADGKYFTYYGKSPFRSNRGTYHYSMYHTHQYLATYNNGYAGPAPLISLAEMDFLRAEAALRQNDVQTALDIINHYHVGIGEMEPITSAIPVGAPGDERDGRPDIGGLGNSIWAVLKYDKGIEIADKNCAVAWTDRRGWGTLVKGTIIYFPIPGDELEVLLMDNYTFGGIGNVGGAPKVLPPPIPENNPRF